MKLEFKLPIIPRRLFVFTVFSILLLSACPSEEKSADAKTPLILISMDGFRWDYFDKTDTPNFDELIQLGSQARALIPVFPSKTFPNHISIVTGRYPENHGIIANTMYDPVFDEYYYIGQGSKPVLDGKWYEAEPIWVTAEKQDQTAMTMFWPASEAEILGIRPTEYFVYDGSISHNARVDQILKWLDYAPSKRPQFVSTYFSHMDDVGHDHGPDSEEVIAGIQEMDRTIGRLIGGLKSRDMFKNTNIILVTDHGMASTSPDSMIFLDDYIDMDNVTMVDWTPVASILPKGNVDPIYVKLKNAHPKLSVYKKGEAPAQLHYNTHRRIQPITAVAHEHWSISTRVHFNENNNSERYNGATHGYDPIYKSMGGIFVGYGPAFKSGIKGPGLTNIHLYEMMCRILGLVPAENDGSLDSTQIFLTN
ncbi:MAG: ectonucleotide pyrophosphatase/phosphodiesterase [Candidatus Marinimicrobia bacterium]|jgi:predicted AlkP superfamily pyrophosphatase or phosphodiesterase|nr:ectonucleotide pyrophosphatase/phosphodiesterase [Candidatus Neomarinimicrobiota bacterium]|tara:strand:+ start:6234 stop:7499 length:1266 start_codon:yes stop_codon:yes gene_type:complete